MYASASLAPEQVRRNKRKTIKEALLASLIRLVIYMSPVTSQDILSPDGPLAGRLEGFVPRRAQQEMAARIEQALADYSVFIAESGTGTGKTFAYLVPALLSGKKVLISTRSEERRVGKEC